MADNAKNENVRVRALELIGKSLGMFGEKSQTIVLKQEMREKRFKEAGEKWGNAKPLKDKHQKLLEEVRNEGDDEPASS